MTYFFLATTSVLFAALAGVTHAFDEGNGLSGGLLSVVMRGGEVIDGADDEKRVFFNYYCDMYFPPNGALSSGIYGTQGLWNTDFRPMSWGNANSLCSPPVRYKLQEDGNFVITCLNNTIDYITHSHQGKEGDYFMAFDRYCELHIFEGTFGCNEIDIRNEVWSSDKRGPWEIEDRLYKGQIYHGLSYYETVLTPSGNLEVRQPGSRGTYDVLWSAGKEWEASPGDHLHDFYAKLTPEGTLILVGIDYEGGMVEEEYFRKDLNSGGADCYKLGFEVVGEAEFGDAHPIDLIAVSCDN
mmetsp:Transcript_11855/g.28367  ORF Transcript_11855/g.28367 Transcript_11855/m.28367 type:complete len:297 (+) Transcript_11855:58-948(+)